MATIADLWVNSSLDAWVRLGFEVSQVDEIDGSHSPLISIAGLGLRFKSGASSTESVIHGWTVVGEHKIDNGVDGIATNVVGEPTANPSPQNALTVDSIDHIVIITGSLERTCGAIASQLGIPLKRTRDAGHGVRQGFHRAGGIILEIVERPDLSRETPASLWGLVFVVQDIDQAIKWFGPDAVGEPRDAVQTGRRIVSVKQNVGLGLAVALMSPDNR